MTKYEIISVALSSIAIVLSGITFWLSYSRSKATNAISDKAFKESEKANRTAFGNIEFTINERISSTQERVADRLDLIAPLLAKQKTSSLNDEEKELLNHYNLSLESSKESNINVYEEACAKYLDDKIDKERFRRSYSSSIRQLVEHPDYKKYFDPITTKYKAILKVYKEWNDLEN